MKRILYVCGIIIICLGIGWTIKDYRAWQHLEMDNYGHGPPEKKSFLPISQLYQNETAGLRIRYPQNWQAVTSGVFNTTIPVNWKTVTDMNGKMVAAINDPRENDNKEAAQVQVWLYARKATDNLVDLVDQEVKTMGKTAGVHGYGERQYIQTEKGNMTVVTWVDELPSERQMIQEGFAKQGEKYVIVKLSVGVDNFTKYEGVFWEMLQSVAVL